MGIKEESFTLTRNYLSKTAIIKCFVSLSFDPKHLAASIPKIDRHFLSQLKSNTTF